MPSSGLAFRTAPQRPRLAKPSLTPAPALPTSLRPALPCGRRCRAVHGRVVPVCRGASGHAHGGAAAYRFRLRAGVARLSPVLPAAEWRACPLCSPSLSSNFPARAFCCSRPTAHGAAAMAPVDRSRNRKRELLLCCGPRSSRGPGRACFRLLLFPRALSPRLTFFSSFCCRLFWRPSLPWPS